MAELTNAAFREAGRLGHHWVGAEHLLLALTQEPPGAPARDALDSCRVREPELRAALVADRSWPRGPDPAGGIWPSPLVRAVEGGARGFAAAEGSPEARPEHVLLALAWEPHGRHALLLRDRSVTSTGLQAALARQGVAVPDLDPPPFRGASDFGESVEVSESELRALLDMISPLLWPPEITVAVSRHEGGVSVRAAASIDLAAQLARLRSTG